MFSYILFNRKENLFLAFIILMFLISQHQTIYAKTPIFSEENINYISKIIDSSSSKRSSNYKQIGDSDHSLALKDLSDWIYFTHNTEHIDLKELKKYYLKYQTWPSISKIKIAIEKKIQWFSNSENNDENWLHINTPISYLGKIKLSDNILKNKKLDPTYRKKHLDIIVNSWINGKFKQSDENYILKYYSSSLSQLDNAKRLDNLIWNRDWKHAKRQLKRVSEEYYKLAIARIKLARRSYGVDEAVSKVPVNLKNDEGLVYERIRWRRISNLRESSLEMLKHYLSNGNKINNPDRWWIEINWHTRKLIEMNNPSEAYNLLKFHGQKSIINISSAEWLSGWIALQFLNDPEKAKIHFLKMISLVKMPISKARANYWLGRTDKILGSNSSSLEYFKKAANFNSTYYGLLSNQLIPENLRTSKKIYLKFDIEYNILKDPRLNALRLLAFANEQRYSRKFINGLINKPLDAVFIEKILHLLKQAKRTDLFIISTKKAIKYDPSFQKYLFPFPYDSKINFNNAKENIDQSLLISMAKQESEFFSNAKSRVGALGILQVMPKTAKLVSKKLGINYNKKLLANNPNYNIKIASTYLYYLLEEFNGSLVLALASYNAGPTRVTRWIKTYGNPNDKDIDTIDWIEKIPFRETRNYVQRILENYVVYQKVLQDREAEKQKNILKLLEQGS